MKKEIEDFKEKLKVSLIKQGISRIRFTFSYSKGGVRITKSQVISLENKGKERILQ